MNHTTYTAHPQLFPNFDFNNSSNGKRQRPSSSSSSVAHRRASSSVIHRRAAATPRQTLLIMLRSIPLSAIMPYLPISALFALRDTSRSLSALLRPVLFGHVHARLSPGTFSEPSLQALHRIGGHARKLTLTLAHSAATVIALVPRDPAAATAATAATAAAASQLQPQPYPRFDALVPLPRDGVFGNSGNFVLLPFAHQCKPASQELYAAAVRASGWRQLFSGLPALRELVLRAPLPPSPSSASASTDTDTPPSAIAISSPMQRSVVDEALKYMVHIWDSAFSPSSTAPPQTPRLRLMALEWDGHAGGLMALDPRASWDGRGVARGWWATVRRLVVRVDPRSLAGCEDWEHGATTRALASMLDAMGQQLVFVSIDAGGLDSPCVSTVTGEEGVDGQMMPRLVEMELDGVATAWADLERFLNARAPKVVRLTAGHRVVFREGDDGWRGLYAQWELETVPRSERDPFVLRRKDEDDGTTWR